MKNTDSTTGVRAIRRSAPRCSPLSVDQISIAFGKYVAGYRPSDEGWTELDQQAVDYVMTGSFIRSNDGGDGRDARRRIT